MKLVTSILLSLILLLQGCASLRPPELSMPFDGNYDPVTTYLSRFIEREMKKSNLTGLSIALVDGDNLVWSEGFGFADKASKIAATATTVYRAGSVSKLFNAIAIMQLVEQGKLDLDVPVANYLPTFKINSRFGSTNDITLRSLLSHQSGMPSDTVDAMWSEEPPALSSLLDALKDSYVVQPANRAFNYSNTGISLSGLALESVAGIAYERHLQSAVLDVLGMKNSDFTGKLSSTNPVKAYQGDGEVKELALRDTPAGGLNTTVNDLSQFLMAIHGQGRFKGKTLIQESTLSDMLSVQNEGRVIDMDLKMGLAWFHAPELLGGRYAIVGHNGRTIAHSAKLVTAPEAGLGVIVLSNSADNANALNRIAKEAMYQLFATTGIPPLPAEDNASIIEKLETTPDLAGDYAGPFDLIQIKPDGQYFHADGLGMKASLRPESDNWYSVKIKVGGLTLQPDDLKAIRVTRARIDDVERLVGTDDGTPFLLGDLIEPYPATDNWDALLGEYRVRNPIEAHSFGIKEIHFKRAADFYYIETTDNQNNTSKSALRPLNDSQFIFLGTGRSLGETVTLRYENSLPIFTYSGLVFEKSE